MRAGICTATATAGDGSNNKGSRRCDSGGSEIAVAATMTVAAAAAQLQRKGGTRAKRIFPRYPTAAPLAALVLHRARATRPSFHGHCAAAPVARDCLDAGSSERRLA